MDACNKLVILIFPSRESSLQPTRCLTMAYDMFGPFSRSRRRELMRNYEDGRGDTIQFITGAIVQIAPGFIDEETRKPLSTILVERRHEFQTVIDLLMGESFTVGKWGDGKMVETCTMLVPQPGYAFITKETRDKLFALADAYGFAGWNCWQILQWDEFPALEYEREAEKLAAMEKPPLREALEFVKAYIKALGPKVHDKVTGRTLEDVLNDADALTVKDVLNLIIGGKVQDSYDSHELDKSELFSRFQDKEMRAHLSKIFIACGWAESQMDWSEF